MLVLAIALPLLVVAGLRARRPIPRMERLPEGLVASVAEPAATGSPRIVSWDGGSLRASLSRGLYGAASTISIELLQELTRPDLLVYWSDDLNAEPESLPGNAQLLGLLAGRYPIVFELPVQALDADGQVILYSPTQGEVVTSFRLSASATSADGDSG
jgi:hypothetical protein